MLERDLIAEMRLRSGITARLATVAGTTTKAIHNNVLPEGSDYPAVLVTRISTSRERALSGPSGLAHPRVQVSVFAEKIQDCREIAALIRGEFDGWSGVLTGGTSVNEMNLLDERDLYEEEPQVHRTDLDFEIWHHE